ncbi:mitochondrial dicarboxylate carrier [Paraphysoderma sedebokerense]|nr:mitochondrial dicarboxylate carrier [Paraphysoderma sedebokerense]
MSVPPKPPPQLISRTTTPSEASKPLPHIIRYPFYLGGIASCVAVCITHPLDLLKVRLQTHKSPTPPSLVSICKHILKCEGILGLYSGLSASLLRQATYSTVRFGMFDICKNALSTPTPDGEVKFEAWKSVVSGIVAGCLGGAAGTPSDLVNVRMQNDSALPIEQRRNYRHALDGLYQIVKSEGILALFRGLSANIGRAVLMTSSQLVSYDISKGWLMSWFGWEGTQKRTWMCASVMAALVATTITSPVDVLKTRIMNSSESVRLSKIAVDVVRNEGFLKLFSGWTPAAVRLAPQTIVTFMILEQLKKMYRERLLQKLPTAVS